MLTHAHSRHVCARSAHEPRAARRCPIHRAPHVLTHAKFTSLAYGTCVLRKSAHVWIPRPPPAGAIVPQYMVV